jgi:hypothetical protein
MQVAAVAVVDQMVVAEARVEAALVENKVAVVVSLAQLTLALAEEAARMQLVQVVADLESSLFVI